VGEVEEVQEDEVDRVVHQAVLFRDYQEEAQEDRGAEEDPVVHQA
jgi:hypothetical protein